MGDGTLILTVHRSANEIGGNCVELALDGHRLILDAGSPLAPDGAAALGTCIPATLNVTTSVDALVLSHPHQDHHGLLQDLPSAWPVWCGAAAEELIRLTASLRGGRVEQPIQNYRPWSTFTAGPFSITPYLTDHSALDAHMLLVECGGKRILYSGDFRRAGRKASLVDRMMKAPPHDIDVLLLEGTTLGRTEAFPTETELEQKFIDLFERTPGRVFVTWSAQNIDRTVTIYRACKQAQRTLVLDLYTLDVLDRLSSLYDSLPRLGWKRILCVVSVSMKRLYEDPNRMNNPEFVTRCASTEHAIGAAGVQARRDIVVMLRPSLLRDYTRKGVTIAPEDAWVFSMWSGYLKSAEYEEVRRTFEAAGSTLAQIHTSGHASGADLEEFAARMAPRYLVPIHSFDWDSHVRRFANVRRLQDGEPFAIE
jgi:ribonuclease J